ncbi:hypothetical protein ACFOMD_13705 [Sphingoaurantiacus capsulatus]|uniref:Nutrient deprivation-induced protein n=1 Tax=Sphingoaurantiacus capsulatus TaxID=1771310 RepID=A0ABV7XCJ9_9SPHN
MTASTGPNGNIGSSDPTGTALGASTAVVDPAASGGFGDDDAGTGRFARVREEASRLKGEATGRARGYAEDGKAIATDKLDGFARSIHDMAGNFEEQVGPQLAQYAHSAADKLDEISANLRNKSVDELVDDARGFVRRSPAIAIGAAVAVGFALSRFLKASNAEAKPRKAKAAPKGRKAKPRYDA